jgi:hypothetical protein
MSISLEDAKKAIREALLEQSNTKEQVETHVDHVCDCPDCLCGVMDKLNKESEYMCEHCGFPLGDEKMLKALPDCPNCPNCHQKRPVKTAKRRG